jgi:exonuclease III
MTQNKSPLNLVSLNVRGLSNCIKKANLFHWFEKQHDIQNKIVLLQETHVTKEKEAKWKEIWHGDMYFSNGTSNSRGTAILIPRDLIHEIHDEKLDPNGRFVALKIEIDGNIYGIINGYAPTSDMLEEQLVWLKSISDIIDDYGDTNLIFGGDINDGLTKLDKFVRMDEWKESEYVLGWKEICREYQLVDMWRILYPHTHKHTWRQGTCKKNLRRSRLDFWIISTSLIYDVDKCTIEPGFGSDHSLITLSLFKKKQMDQGPSFWKFNTSLLREREYTAKVTEEISRLKIKYAEIEDCGMKWDLIKMELRMGAISYSKFLANKKRTNLKELIGRQVTLENEIAENPNDNIIQEAEEVKTEIENHNAEKARGAWLRSKADWVEFGEKNSNFFLRLENRNKQVKNIATLLDETGKEISVQSEILEAELDFYKKLYTQPEEKVFGDRERVKQMFMADNTPKISDEEKEIGDSEITYDEIGRALKDLKNGKTPGTDGFPPDFYKFFWKDIGNLVYESIIQTERKGEMSIDQRRGVINLIPKKDKDLRYLKNWRPISLLNTDYKILTKTLASRLKKILPSVIHPDQVAYLKGRYIGQNIRTIIDIMEYTKEKKLEGIIAFLDFEKAFDSIDWRIIDEALEKFNIGKKFRKWVKSVYHNITSCVTNCGFSSKDFKITRGVRQGCPLSAYLFIVVAEILAIRIRANRDIKGIQVGDSEIKVVQMADDTTSFLKNEEALSELLSTINDFGTLAGLKLNLTKSEAMWMGKNRDSKEKPLGLKWVKGVKALGIHFSYNEKEELEQNFTKKLKELKKLLAIWGQRDLSVLGRIQVFKNLAFAKIIYQCNNLAVPSDFLKELNTIAFNFIWGYKPEKVKRDTIISAYEDGGLKMLDVESFVTAQKIMWVKRLLKSKEGSWKIIPDLILAEILGDHSFQCSTVKGEQIKSIPLFYRQLFIAWNKTKVNPGDDPFRVRREVLWHNKQIKIRGKEICYKIWYDKGIVMIHDIVQENGEFKSKVNLEMQFQTPIGIMEYNGLKSAIPQAWKRAVKSMRIPDTAISKDEQPFMNCKNGIQALSILTNKEVYWEFVNKKQVQPICALKWCGKFGIDMADWKSLYLTYAGIRDTKMKAFQFKVLNNLIPCNLYLARIGKSNTNTCGTCNELDDIVHYMVECPETKAIWNKVSFWWRGICGQEIDLSKQDIILGMETKNAKLIMKEQLDVIILATKWKIYTNKQLGQELDIFQVKRKIKQTIDTLEYIANRNQKLGKHDKIWEKIIERLPQLKN